MNAWPGGFLFFCHQRVRFTVPPGGTVLLKGTASTLTIVKLLYNKKSAVEAALFLFDKIV